jgi:integrase
MNWMSTPSILVVAPLTFRVLTTIWQMQGGVMAKPVAFRLELAATFIVFCIRLSGVPSSSSFWLAILPEAFKKRLPKVERREITTLTTEQSARLLAAIKHTRIYWPVLLALSTGMRRGEVFALRWKNVDLENGALRVMESLEQTKDGIRFKAPKSERTRVVTLPAFAVTELRRLKVRQAEELLAIGVRQSGDTLVCARADGLPYSHKA